MSAGRFTVVSDDTPAKPETVGERVRRLQVGAKALARDHVNALVLTLAHVEQMAAEIAEGGDAYPPGVRDLCRRLAEDAEAKTQTLESILARTP